MDSEKKRVDLRWEEKTVSTLDEFYLYDLLMEIDDHFLALDTALDMVGQGIGYASKKEEMDRVLEERRYLRSYAVNLQPYIQEKIDRPLQEGFQKANEALSRIRLENYETPNTFGFENVYHHDENGREWDDHEVRPMVRLADFVGTDLEELDSLEVTLQRNSCANNFNRLFAGQYQQMKELGLLEQGATKEKYLENLMHQGEFEYHQEQPFLSLVSGVLDVTLVKPLLEMFTEKDLITGEELSETDLWMKLVFTSVDMVTLGYGLGATHLSEFGGKEALSLMGKAALMDVASNAAAYGVGELGKELELPAPVTILLSMGAGITVSKVAGKYVFRNSKHEEIAVWDKGSEGGTKSKIDYITSNGLELEATQGKTTTVLGTYQSDTGAILDELENVKSLDFGPRDGGFNLLNTPDELYVSPEQFWMEYNKPWLDNVIARDDIVYIATEPTWNNLTRINRATGKTELTGFGREYTYLKQHGYKFDTITKIMSK